MWFNPDGRWLVTGGMKTNLSMAEMYSGAFTRVRLSDSLTGQPRSAELWPEGNWCQMFFTADSSRLYVMNSRKIIYLWDAVAGQPLTPPGLNLRNQVLHWASGDGQLLITKRGSSIRLWEAATGEPVTPLLADWTGRRAQISWTMFVRESSALLAKGEDWVESWPLPADRRPIEELAAHAQLLAARRLETNGAQTPLPPADLKKLWKDLRSERFGPASDQATRTSQWHERAADACEQAKRWFSAAFHLKQMLGAQPNDPTLQRRWPRTNDQAVLEPLTK